MSAAHELTDALLKKDGYSNKSDLMKRVERGISQMADEIAVEIIAENVELRALLDRHTRAIIAAALRDDTYLNRIVTEALAKGLGQFVHERNIKGVDE